MSKTFTREEVARHASENDLWVIIDTDVYDLSNFVDLHPGGAFPILELAGKDATTDFYGLHRQEVLVKYKRYKIGSIAGEKAQFSIPQPGELSKVPYAESSAFSGFKSPYYKESHFQFRTEVRKIMAELAEEFRELDQTDGKPSDELMQKLGETGLLACNVGPGPHLKGINIPAGVKPEEFDYFHEMIVHEEFARVVPRGVDDGVIGGFVIAIPTVLNFAKPHIREKHARDILLGKKRICLAITEPYTGSDVSRIRTTAKLSADGSHYIVNGVKKWITSGRYAQFFSTAVRTDKGLSMLLIERGEGVETKAIRTSYSPSAGTAYVTFDNVKVPVENLLGVENQGFKVVLSNFNHERLVMLMGASAAGRLAVEECLKWANQRKVFGKRLIDQPVIRNKLANMISQVEAFHNWLENLTFQMNHMNYAEQSEKLAGPIALAKYQATRMLHNVSDDACQIFGGRGITKTGMGRYVEMMQRTYKFSAILGGSEEIMADLGVRQAMKHFPKEARL
ncbi:acyl-CoA dehydrogenase NM domain-like protein [Hesseltinella vesiculosa]|uniref:Acyl-CoA dehydrogenase NM domain-like protein n=1 Tax=Hesseltinella vesiculosa TaxID=101127 RepID=A0A1X2GXZ7_9FUNG|nr:acyl-CoA dehydrogenase NM domain-like protein [Hesseltinella vesiculosa]